MKIKYEFATETVEIEVDEHFGSILIDLNHEEYNSNRKETRRHSSLDGMDYEGEWFNDGTDILCELIWKSECDNLQKALKKLKPMYKC